MAKKKSTLQKVGGWAFIVGIILAIIISLMAAFGGSVPGWAATVLAILGLIVGFLNISPEETAGFLIASVAFLVSFGALSTLTGMIMGVGPAFATFFGLMAVFVAPAAAVVAFFAILGIVRD